MEVVIKSPMGLQVKDPMVEYKHRNGNIGLVRVYSDSYEELVKDHNVVINDYVRDYFMMTNKIINNEK